MRHLPAIPDNSLERKIRWWATLSMHVGPVLWKGYRKIGRLIILDNDMNVITDKYIAGADPYK